jgi:hypothetical protein
LKNTIVATLAVLVATVVVVTGPATIIGINQSAYAAIAIEVPRTTEPKAPMAASQDGNNIYVVWWTNRTGNWEVMFRASNDGGQTFGDRINLSNTPETQSQTAEILAVGNSVFVTWWESSTETGSSESVLRVSTDGGQTFGPVISLGTNGTITTTASGNNSTTAAPTG